MQMKIEILKISQKIHFTKPKSNVFYDLSKLLFEIIINCKILC